MRDINLEDTIYPRFTTRAFATGIPTTLGGTPVLSVYEENNLTQITAGVSVSADYDSVTGLNQATIVATAANGYEAGKSYDVVITTGTVGGVSVVGEVVYSFTIEDAASVTSVAALNDVSAADVNAQCDTAISDAALSTAAALATAQADLDTITGSDGATLASSQSNTITWGAQIYSVTGATANITYNGSGTGAVFAYTRGGTSTLFDSAYSTDLQAECNAACDTALVDYDPATGAEIAALNDVAATDIVSGGAITTSGGAVSNVTTVATTTTNTDMVTEPPTAIENADALLNRDMATGTDSGSPTVRTVRQALRFLRNKWSVSGTTLTVTKEDDSTASWTATVTTDATADPVTGSDPA